MKSWWLCFVCCCYSVLTTSGCFRVDGYSCVTAYRKSITCVVNITVNPMGQTNTTYTLRLTDRSENVTCHLVPRNHSYMSDCQVKDLRYKNYNIEVCSKSGCQPLTKGFIPTKNLQLTAPRGLEIHRMPEAINITWESGYENHPYLRNSLDYELLISRKLDSSKRMTLQKTFKSIPRERLEAPATYCFKVRSKAFVRDYSGTWSEWSSKICGDFAKEEQDNILITLTTYLGPVFVTVGFLLVAFLSPSARMKMNIFSIPSPAPFFKPLLQHHEGNVKEWLSPWGNFALTHESDEILTIVSIEPKVTEINSEEIKESWDSSLTPLTLTKCQNSYVCVPKTTELSLTIPSNHTDQNLIG